MNDLNYDVFVEEIKNGTPLHKIPSRIEKQMPGENVSFYVSESAEVYRKFLEKRNNINLKHILETSLEKSKIHIIKIDDVEKYLGGNYLGGGKDGRPISINGKVKLRGDVSGEFYIPLRPSRWGVSEGVNAGFYKISKAAKFGNELDSVEIAIESSSIVTRSPAIRVPIEKKEEITSKIKNDLYKKIKSKADSFMNNDSGELGKIDYSGELSKIEIAEYKDILDVLYLNFIYAMRGDYHGHDAVTATTREVMEYVCNEIPDIEMLMIAGGVDGDLRPSEKNIRGRRVEAKIRVPEEILKEVTANPKTGDKGATIENIICSNNAKQNGNRILGTYTFCGMAPEIIDGFFNALEPPVSPFVSSRCIIEAQEKSGLLELKAVLPNAEFGTMDEGPASLTASENRSILGIDDKNNNGKNVKVALANLGAAVVAGEFNQLCQMYARKLGSEKYRVMK